MMTDLDVTESGWGGPKGEPRYEVIQRSEVSRLQKCKRIPGLRVGYRKRLDHGDWLERFQRKFNTIMGKN
jgi:hypothetical protein